MVSFSLPTIKLIKAYVIFGPSSLWVYGFHYVYKRVDFDCQTRSSKVNAKSSQAQPKSAIFLLNDMKERAEWKFIFPCLIVLNIIDF